MKKPESDGLKKINVFFLNKKGYFSGSRFGTITWISSCSGNVGSANLEVSTSSDKKYLSIHFFEDEKKYDCTVLFTATSCRYGSVRYWFICPTWHCGRRIGTLYLGNDGFACRHCYNLSYSSRNESRRYRRFVSIPDLDKQMEKVRYPYYRGKPTKKYSRYLQMEDSFYRGWVF